MQKFAALDAQMFTISKKSVGACHMTHVPAQQFWALGVFRCGAHLSCTNMQVLGWLDQKIEEEEEQQKDAGTAKRQATEEEKARLQQIDEHQPNRSSQNQR